MRRAAALAAAGLLAAGCARGGGGPAATATTRAGRAPAPVSSTAVTSTTVAPPPATRPAGPAVPPAAPGPVCPPVPPSAGLDPNRPRYTIDLTVDLAANEVTGALAVRFVPDVPTDRLVFRLWPNGPRVASGGGRLETGEVLVDGRAAPVSQPDPTTLVVATGPLTPGAPVAAALPWRLVLPGAVDDRVARIGDSVRLGSFFPLLAWEPGTGWATEPPTTGFAEAATSPAADFDVGVSVPPGLGVLTSGVAGADGRLRVTGARDFAISVGRFRLATAVAHAPEPVAVTVGVADGVHDAPQAYLAKVVRVLEDFGHRLGAYPWPSFTLGVTPGLGGGIEFPAHVMQGPGTLGRTTTHEVAHQWFYGLVGNNQGRDPWLDEGTASYAEARVEGTLAAFRAKAIPAGARGRAGAPMTYWEPRPGSYYRGVYVQGAVALAATGDVALVDCALRHVVARNAFRIARPADVIAAFDAVLPGASATLAAFGITA